MSNVKTCAICVKQDQDLRRYTGLYNAIGACPLKEHYRVARINTRKAQIAHSKVCVYV